jgi:hypothetical protein
MHGDGVSEAYRQTGRQTEVWRERWEERREGETYFLSHERGSEEETVMPRHDRIRQTQEQR